MYLLYNINLVLTSDEGLNAVLLKYYYKNDEILTLQPEDVRELQKYDIKSYIQWLYSSSDQKVVDITTFVLISLNININCIYYYYYYLYNNSIKFST